jgi:hypothetical protein
MLADFPGCGHIGGGAGETNQMHLMFAGEVNQFVKRSDFLTLVRRIRDAMGKEQ